MLIRKNAKLKSNEKDEYEAKCRFIIIFAQKKLRIPMVFFKNMKTKKIVLSLIILALGFNKAKAQDDIPDSSEVQRQNPTGFVALNVGVGTATGNFADKKIGGALSGNAYQISICAPFENSFFGLAAKLNYGTYSMTNQPLYAQQMAENKRFGLDTAVKFKSNINQQFTQITCLIGMLGTLPILSDERLSLDARVLFGPTVIKRPALSIDSIGGNDYSKTYTQSASKSNSFVYDFGFTLRYNLLKSKKLCLMVNFDYLKTNGNFEVESNSRYSNDSDVLQEGVHTEKIKYSISSYDITGGIGYVW